MQNSFRQKITCFPFDWLSEYSQVWPAVTVRKVSWSKNKKSPEAGSVRHHAADSLSSEESEAAALWEQSTADHAVHSPRPRDKRQGMRSIPQGPRRINSKCSGLRGGQLTPRHQETRNRWLPQGLEKHILRNFRWKHVTCYEGRGAAGVAWKHAGDCQASFGAAVGELSLGKGQQQLLPEPRHLGPPGTVLVIHKYRHIVYAQTY